MNEVAPAAIGLPIECPYSKGSRDFNPIFDEGVYAALAAARTDEPVFFCPEIDHWVVTKHRDVLAILQDPALFSARNASTRLTPMHEDGLRILQEGNFRPETTQASMDPPRHTRIRNATNPLLNVRTVAALETRMRAIVRRFVDRLEGMDRIDLIKEFTYELPAYVIFLLLGIPEEHAQHVKQVAMGRAQIDFSPSTAEQQTTGARNLVGLWDYTVKLVEEHIRAPKDDFVGGLLMIRNGDDAIMTMNELTTIVYGIMFAGHETTTNQLTNTIYEMLADRPNWDAICADPSLIPNAVEEGLRHCGAVIAWRRTATQDVEISGVSIPKDAKIMLSFASANRDEAVFENPDRFDVRRKNARKHFTLGNGIHVCLGAPLARVEMKIVLEEFSRRYPNIRLVDGQDQGFLHTFIFRAPTSLMVDLNP